MSEQICALCGGAPKRTAVLNARNYCHEPNTLRPTCYQRAVMQEDKK